MFITAPPMLVLRDLQTPMPCSDQIWGASSEQWHENMTSAEDQPSPLPNRGMSVCEALASAITLHRVPEGLSEAAQLGLLLSAFSQHSQFLDLAQALRTSQPISPYDDLAASLQACLGKIIQQALEGSFVLEQERLGLLEDCAVMARLTAILSFVPQKLLLQFGYWQTSSAAPQEARQQLRQMMHDHAQRTRECAYHAAQLFAHFRKRTRLSHIDPFCLLVATVFLWAYIELFVQNSNIETSSSGCSARILVRLDLGLDSTQISRWIDSGSDQRPHITGVGAFDTERSHVRLLKEASRIIGIGPPRSKLAAGISRMLHIQALGHLPVTETDG